MISNLTIAGSNSKPTLRPSFTNIFTVQMSLFGLSLQDVLSGFKVASPTDYLMRGKDFYLLNVNTMMSI